MEQQLDLPRDNDGDRGATSATAPANEPDASAVRGSAGDRPRPGPERSASASLGTSEDGKHIVTVDLPRRLAPLKSELAIWRAFLADEIEAILRDGG